MIARTVRARPSLGAPGTIWIDIAPTSTGEALGAHLSPADALRLAGALLLAVETLQQEEQGGER